MPDYLITANRLAALPATHARLAALTGTGGRGGERERVTGGNVEAPLPISDRVVELRADIETRLAIYVNATVDAMVGVFRRPATQTPHYSAVFLLSAWPYLCGVEWFPMFADEIDELTNRADAIVDPPERRQVADKLGQGLIDGRDVATALGVGPSTVRAWVAAGDLAVKQRGPNGRNYYALDDIRRLKIRRDNRAA